MKQLFLLAFSFLIFGVANSQTSLNTYMEVKHPSLQSLQPYDRGAAKYGIGNEPVFIGPQPATIRIDGQAEGSIVIGTTIYDLQTNSSVARRMLQLSGGAMTVVYTMSQDAAYADRGTGYTHFDGTTWTVLNPTVRLEPIRTGWPTIALLNDKELDIAHDGAVLLLQQGISNGIGLGTPADWTFTQSGASAPVSGSGSIHGSVWPRITTNGNSIHVVSSYDIADTANIVNGVKAPFVYGRSTDGGVTWTPNIALPNYDSTRTIFGSADDYDIDYNAGVLALVHGGLGEDVSLWTSTDDGATFTHTYVDSFEYAPDYSVSAPIDLEIPTNDGSVSVVVDANGQPHVAYAEGVVVNDATIGAAFQPGWIGLRYWTTGMDTAFSIPILLTDVDEDGDGEYLVGSFTTDVGYCRYGNNSILHKPSISYDTLGNVFITFSLPHDADTTFDGQSFRDIFIAYHDVNADITEWTITNITKTFFVEEAFAHAGRVADTALHIAYQEDFEPGTALTNGDPADFANINYIPFQNPFITGIEDVKHANGFSVSQNYPNPFTAQTQIDITIKNATEVNVKVTNLLGQAMIDNNYTLAAGIHNVTFNRADLSSGVYFYTVTAGTQSISNKMIVE